MPSSNPLHTAAPDPSVLGSPPGLRFPVAAVAGLHVIGSVLFAVAMARNETHALTAAVGLAAYLLGVRHAFDADHIVAIDNTTRYLRARRHPARSVGFWFSLGHSTVVFVACVLVGIGWHSLAAQMSGTETVGATVAGLWGPAVSGTFLIVLAAVNARLMVNLWRNRSHAPTDGLASRGFLTRLIGGRRITRPRQMVVVGFLFALGFDTATSVGLLLLGAGAQHTTLSWSAFLALPLLFAAGMTLFDSANGVAMNRAYGWADTDSRRLRYNLAVTAASVLAAAAVGTLTLASLIGELLPT